MAILRGQGLALNHPLACGSEAPPHGFAYQPRCFCNLAPARLRLVWSGTKPPANVRVQTPLVLKPKQNGQDRDGSPLKPVANVRVEIRKFRPNQPQTCGCHRCQRWKFAPGSAGSPPGLGLGETGPDRGRAALGARFMVKTNKIGGVIARVA